MQMGWGSRYLPLSGYLGRNRRLLGLRVGAPHIAFVHAFRYTLRTFLQVYTQVPMAVHESSFRGLFKLALALFTITNVVLVALTILNHKHQQSADHPNRKSPHILSYCQHTDHPDAIEYTYLGDSFPADLPLPPFLSALPSVKYAVESSTRYTPSAAAIPLWFASLPRRLGYVRLGPRKRIFAVSMSHSAHCMYVFAQAIAEAGAMHEGHLQHCMNYVRQHVLCEVDTTLEEPTWLERAGEGMWGIGEQRERVCRDWREVYQIVGDDYSSWMEFRAQNWHEG